MIRLGGVISATARLSAILNDGVRLHFYRIDRAQRALLPGRHLVQHRIGNRADQFCRRIDAVDLGQMFRNLAGAQPPRIHRDDLVIEARKPALAFGDQLRIEAARTVTGNRNLDLPRAGRHRLAAVAVPAVLDLRVVTE